MLVCVPPLYPATPGWGVRCGCVCLGWGFGCAPPLLAGVLGCACLCASSPCTPPLLAGVCGVGVCAWAQVWAAPRHSWLGCCGVCVLVCALRLYPAIPGWVVRCGCVCLGWGLGCAPPLVAGCWGVRVCVRASSVPATPGWGVRRGYVCLGSGFGCAPPLLAGVLGCVCAGVRALLVPRHSWLGCAVWLCVFGLGFWLCPATPGWGVGVCVFVCVLPLYPATPGWGARRVCVRSGSGFGCAPPILDWVLGCVCAGVRAPLVPRHSRLGCAVWVCVFGLGFPLRPATPGWGVGVCVFVCVLPLYHATPGWGVRRGCVCLGSGFGCAPPLLTGVLGCACLCVCSPRTPPLLAGVRGVCVSAWARVSAAPCHPWLGCRGVRVGVRAPLVPRHSWLGCAVWVCVFGFWFWLRPATPCWGVGVFVCWCGLSPCTPLLLAGVCGVGVCVWARVSAAPRHSWLVCWGVRVCVRAPPVPRHSWQGCAAWVCVLGLGFGLRPATLGWGVGVCACWCARSACTLPLLGGVCGVGVCVWARASAAPRHSCHGCWGVRVGVCTPLVLTRSRGGLGHRTLR